MLSRQAQVIVCRSNISRDKKLSEGLLSHLKPLSSKGIHIWDNASLMAGLDIVEETKRAVTFAQIAILCLSIDFQNDPLMIEITPLLRYRAFNDRLHLIPILLWPLSPSTGFEDFQYLDRKPIARMEIVEREEAWVKVYSLICNILNIQSSPNLSTVLSEKAILDLYSIYTKFTDHQVSLFSGSTYSFFNHGLTTKPEKVYLSGRTAWFDVTQAQILVTATETFRGLAIATTTEE